MTNPINGVPRDQYGMWCPHGKHVLVADPEDTSDHPATIPADPWPCGSCTLSRLEAELKAEAEEYEQDRWDEYRALTHSTMPALDMGMWS